MEYSSSNLRQGNSISETFLELRGWGDGVENDVIIGNVLRLRPDQLLELLDFVAVNPTASKSTLVPWIRSCHPKVEEAFENLSHTLSRVIGERLNIFPEELGVGREVRLGAQLPHSFWRDPRRRLLDGGVAIPA